MLITVKKSNCKYLKELSYYNHNLYELPFEIDGCRIIQEVYDETWDTYNYFFGKIENKKFISCFCIDSYCTVGMAKYLIAFEALISI